MPESIVCFEDLHVGHVVLGVVLGVWEFGSVGVWECGSGFGCGFCDLDHVFRKGA